MDDALLARGPLGLSRLTFIIVVGVAGLLLLLFALILPFVRQPTTTPLANTTVTDIVERPDEFSVGTVTVVARVGESISPQVFTLVEDTAADQPAEILVIAPGLATGIPEAATTTPLEAQVTGVVRQFDQEMLERELGMPLDEQALGRFEGQPVIVARSVFI